MNLRCWLILGAVIGVVIVVPATTFAADEDRSGSDKPVIAKSVIDEIVEPFLKGKPYLGLVVGTTQPQGRQILGYGHVTLQGEQQIPKEDTLFEIGSITKTFTGLLLADQVVAGTMRLDDPVQRHLPPELIVPRRDDRDITLLHLATHTSGLPIQPPTIGLFGLLGKDPGNPYAEYRLPNLKGTLANITLTRPIGSKFDYSNLGVGLLGHAVAKAGKASSLEELMIQRIANPLGMVDTRMQLSEEQQQRLADGVSSFRLKASPWTFGCLEGCGALRSTVRDLLAYVEANLGRRETDLKAAFQMAHQPWRETRREGESIGLCWIRKKPPSENRTVVWHNGGTGGYRSFVAFVPETNVGVVVLSTSTNFVDAVGVAILECLDKRDQDSGRKSGN